MNVHKAVIREITPEIITLSVKINPTGCVGCGLADACNKNGEKEITLKRPDGKRNFNVGDEVSVGEYKRIPLWIYLLLAAIITLVAFFPDRPETAAIIILTVGFIYFFRKKYATVSWEILPD